MARNSPYASAGTQAEKGLSEPFWVGGSWGSPGISGCNTKGQGIIGNLV